jgi:putative aldouronate transport system substrate-binding protein
VRQDWLDNLGLAAPTTLEDVVAIAEAFRDDDPDGNGKDDTYGLLGTSDIVNIGNNLYGFDPVFAYYGSYPELWIRDESGDIVYGSITPETRTALAALRDLYAAGLIDREFAIKDTNQANELVVNSQAGVFFAPWWIPFWPLPDVVSLNPAAEWKAYIAPVTNDGAFNTHMISPSSSYLVVKKGFANPAAIVRTCNMQYDMDQIQGEGFYEGQDVSFNWTEMPFTLLLSNYVEKEWKAQRVQDVIDGQADVDTLYGEMLQIYNSQMADLENPKSNLNAWSQANAFLTGALPLNDDRINKVYGVYYSVTPTMERRWSTLETLEDETFLKIILGDEDIDAFDTFVEQWKSLGGDQITEEITELVGD